MLPDMSRNLLRVPVVYGINVRFEERRHRRPLGWTFDFNFRSLQWVLLFTYCYCEDYTLSVYYCWWLLLIGGEVFFLPILSFFIFFNFLFLFVIRNFGTQKTLRSDGKNKFFYPKVYLRSLRKFKKRHRYGVDMIDSVTNYFELIQYCRCLGLDHILWFFIPLFLKTWSYTK